MVELKPKKLKQRTYLRGQLNLSLSEVHFQSWNPVQANTFTINIGTKTKPLAQLLLPPTGRGLCLRFDPSFCREAQPLTKRKTKYGAQSIYYFFYLIWVDSNFIWLQEISD